MTRTTALKALLGAVVLVAPTFLLGGYHLFQLTQTAVYAIAILGLDLLTGQTGQVSLGHGAFYAIGAYAAAILMVDADWPYWATLPVSGAVCAAVGFAVGLPALRLRGHYLALLTFAVAVAVPQLLRAKALEDWTGGVQGLVITGPEAPSGLPLSPDQWLYLFTLAVAAVLFAAAQNLRHGRIWRAMIAVRDHELAAEAAGIDIASVKTRAFALSAMFTGIAGALGAIAVQFVAPDSFSVQLSIALFVGLVVGGGGSSVGVLLGAAFVQFVPNLAEWVSKSAPGLVYGVLLVAALFLMPSGIAGVLRRGARTTKRMGGKLHVDETDAAEDGIACRTGPGDAGAGGRDAGRDRDRDQDRQHQSP
jgi:branched-chain amino acid transport system permease protein